MRFRVHNASKLDLARTYSRYDEQCFIIWAQGSRAEAIWRGLPTWLEDDKPDRIFVSLKMVKLDDKLFQSSLDQGLSRCFPGMEIEIKQILTGVQSQ